MTKISPDKVSPDKVLVYTKWTAIIGNSDSLKLSFSFYSKFQYILGHLMLAECKMSTHFKNYCYLKCRVLLSGMPCCNTTAPCHHKLAVTINKTPFSCAMNDTFGLANLKQELDSPCELVTIYSL